MWGEYGSLNATARTNGVNGAVRLVRAWRRVGWGRAGALRLATWCLAVTGGVALGHARPAVSQAQQAPQAQRAEVLSSRRTLDASAVEAFGREFVRRLSARDAARAAAMVDTRPLGARIRQLMTEGDAASAVTRLIGFDLPMDSLAATNPDELFRGALATHLAPWTGAVRCPPGMSASIPHPVEFDLLGAVMFDADQAFLAVRRTGFRAGRGGTLDREGLQYHLARRSGGEWRVVWSHELQALVASQVRFLCRSTSG